MATEVLIALGKANLAAGAAILAVIAVRNIIRGAFGARLAYALWLAVPLAATAALLPPRTIIETLAQSVITAEAAPAAALEAEFAAIAAPIASAPAATAAPLDLATIAVWIWIAGAITTAAWLMRLQGQFMADVRMGMAGPAVMGVLRPRIVTPSNFAQVFSDREQVVVLAHETTHIARQDVRANALASLVQCACWFNPLIHVAAFLMRIDQELACDAQVVERHPGERRAYAEAMLKSELAGRPLPLGCCWPAGGDHPLTVRMALLKRDKPGRIRRIAGAASIAALCTIGGFAAWAAQPARVEYTSPAELPAQAASSPAAVASVSNAAPAETPHDAPEPAPQPARDRAQPIPVDQPQTAPEPQLPASQQQLPRYAPLGHGQEGQWAPVSITGTITEVKWVAPNVRIYIHGDDGKDWYVLTSTPNRIKSSGGSPDIIRKDVRITLNGRRATGLACAPLCVAMAWETDMTFDGAKLLRPAGAPQPVPSSFEPEAPQQATPPASRQSLPTQAPFPAWVTPNSNDRWVPITISGVITDVKWVNPSTQIYVHGDDGRDWYILSSTPNRIMRSGGSKDIIRKDVRLVVDAQQDLDIACAPLCVAMAREVQMTFNGAKLPSLPEPAASNIFPPAQPWDGVDETSPVTIEGAITDVDWKNPSVLIHITDKSGQTWLVATATPNALLGMGGTREIVAKGVAVTVNGFRPLNKTCAPACGAFANPAVQMTFNGARLTPPPQ